MDRRSVELGGVETGSGPATAGATAARPSIPAALFICLFAFFPHQGKKNPLIITGWGQLRNVSSLRWRRWTWPRGAASGWSCCDAAGRR